MHHYVRVAALAIAAFGLFSTFPLKRTVAHEGHQIKCSETAANAIKADIQSMPDGQAKTTATKELEMAEEMMDQKNMETCEDHMHRAIESIEE